ncbi:MAG: hypothetical protein ACSLFM_03260 [Tepidiformaceae bacterium]
MIRTMIRTTISLRADVLASVDEAVGCGEAANRTAFIDLAIRRHLWHLEQERIDAEIRKMATDPDAIAIGNQIMREFATIDAEAWAKLDEEYGPYYAEE